MKSLVLVGAFKDIKYKRTGPDIRNLIAEDSMLKKISYSKKGQRVLASEKGDSPLKKAEEALLDSQEKYRYVVDNALSGIFVIQDGAYQFVNERAAQIFNTSRKKLLSCALYKFVHPDDRELCANRVNIREQGDTTDELLEHRIIDGNGTIKWVEVRGISIVWDGRHASMCFVNDITDRKKAEEALRQSEARFRKIFENKGTATGTFGNDSIIRECNKLFEELSGYSTSEIIGRKKWSDFVVQEDLERLRTYHAERTKQGATPPSQYECRIIRKSGEIRTVIVNLDLLGEDRIVSLTDISDRKKAEDSLLESKARFRDLVDMLPQIVFEMDMHGNLTFVNQVAFEVFGYTQEEFDAGLNVMQMIAEKDRERAANRIRLILSGQNSPEGHEYTVMKKNGLLFPVIIYSAGFVRDGDTHGLRGIMIDLTDQKAAENEKRKLKEQLQQSQKMEMVGRLAGGVAHDFNNMLSVILGQTDMILEQVDQDQPIHKALEEIKEAGIRSADLTRQLLAFARKQTVSPKVIDLSSTVGNMTKMLKRLIGENIELSWIPDRSVWPVKIDPIQIDQILANLCVNARDAIDGAGKVAIKTENSVLDENFSADDSEFTPGDYVLLAVTDNGCGMPPETQKYLFEPFFTTKKVGKGTGLGLATVYGAVKQNKGLVKVISSPYRGTTFKIYLPRYRTKTDALPEMDKNHPTDRGHETILLVEDEIAILRMTTKMLEKQGYQVVAAKTPDEAICLAQEHAGEIHLLMTDVVMPEMNGRDLAENILSIHPNLKCLFMSGYTADVIAHHGVLDKSVNFIQKPFSRDQLGAKVRWTLYKGGAESYAK